MDKNSIDWIGPTPALITPFDADGNIDEAAYRRNVELCIGYGLTALLPNGCTGEFWAQTIEERKRVIEICVDAAGGRVPVIAGTGAIRTPEVIELTEHAKDAGCVGVMILPPFFVKPSADDIVAHYQTVSDAVDIPIMLYNIPANAVNALVPELVDRLADIDNVVAIKESSADFNNFYKTMQVAGDRIHVILGPTTLYGAVAFALGSAGYVDTSPNFWGEESVEFFNAARDGNMDRALELQAKALKIRDLVNGNGRNMYCSTKAIMNMLGLPGGYPRLPLRPLGEPHLTELRKGIESLGLAAPKAAAAQ